MIVLHESAHCLQYDVQKTADGLAASFYAAALEQDADVQSIELACKLGLDGKGMYLSLWKWFLNVTRGRAGRDVTHGTPAARIELVTKAKC